MLGSPAPGLPVPQREIAVFANTAMVAGEIGLLLRLRGSIYASRPPTIQDSRRRSVNAVRLRDSKTRCTLDVMLGCASALGFVSPREWSQTGCSARSSPLEVLRQGRSLCRQPIPRATS